MEQVTQDRISFRWGIKQLDHGNVIIPEPIYRYAGKLGVTGNQFVLIVQLAAFKYESEGSVACPSFQTLADRMGISRRRVMELVDQLEAAGWLSVTRRTTYRNEYSLEKFAQACWDLYEADTSAESRTSVSVATSAENFTSTSAESRTPLVRNPAPEEQEEKSKKTKNKRAATPRTGNGPVMKRLTEGYAERQGYRPDGDRWKPIQQGYRAMLDAGYSPEQIEACEDRLVGLGWTWTINTVRDWLPRFVGGLMPEPGSGRPSGASELQKARVDAEDMEAFDRALEERRKARLLEGVAS